jgi:nucleoside-diphosphate-sugar epimerase
VKILLTGSDGYIGSVVGPYLVRRGHSVTGLDTGFYCDGSLFEDAEHETFPCIRKDLRIVETQDVAGFDAVVHLAELANDPLGQHNPELTYTINHQGTVALAHKCRSMGISKFVYTSSCSVYGTGTGDFKTEESETNPQTAYAQCKVLVERDVALMATDNFSRLFFGTPQPTDLPQECGLIWS